ncbi:TetR/AcrR family transcriptional regulator [Anoxynatronum buryatiense]|uniref:Transcriptional regulator, TetR family n=1 Tax=Anoxynatronum buryatiense TaxID=489973 RepID=A0AA46AJU9_9CLOT|nr:TetR/AcrR family transcriptional regulator [Anoxynatronum buryatiense]SMP65942.1 transcriptional regulator, TetR family [Anoxynatronum buryatiense]
MNGFELRREKKKKDILQAALQLFSMHGIKNVSIAEIAEKANVSQVSIYNFFESKENLARQAFFKMMDDIMSHLDELVESDLSFREKVTQMRSVSIESGNHFNDIFNQIDFIKDPQILKFLDEYGKNRSIPLFMKLIEQGKREGSLDKNISSESVLIYINAISKALQSNLSKKVRGDLGDLFFYGLFGSSD